MIYTVECSFTNPASEAEWNHFYTFEKLPALISVDGFHTSQRFKALNIGCPTYLAIHSIDNLGTLQGDEYRQKGGGNFSCWQPNITDWHRNLYDGLDCAPAINESEQLVMSTIGPEPLIELDLVPHEMNAIALDMNPKYRWLATLTIATRLNIKNLPKGVYLYNPLTEQLISGGDVTSQILR